MNDTSHVTSCGWNGSSAIVRAFVRLEHDDARVVANPRMELPVADIQGDHARGPALEQDVREPARRRTKIEAVEAHRIETEGIERVGELEAGTRDVRRRPLDLERRLVVHLLAGHRVSRHEPGPHERLGLRATLRETAFHEEDVEPLLRHVVRAAS